MNKRRKTGELSVAPVKKYDSPNYPSLDFAKSNPQILRKLPSRWQNNAKILTTLGLLGTMALSFSACFENQEVDEIKYLNVAPIFEHGNGIGTGSSFMGDVIAYPMFLSEEDAKTILIEGGKKYGLDFSSSPPDYISENNYYEIESKYSWERLPKYYLGDGSVGIDLYDKNKKVGVSFISALEGTANSEKTDVLPEGTDFEFSYPKELAKLVAEDFKNQTGNDTIGVFYDPVYSEKINEVRKEYPVFSDEYTEKTKEVLEQEFKAQMNDFFEWLQGQGII